MLAKRYENPETAQAQTASGHTAKKHGLKEVQEFVEVNATDANGAVLPFQTKTFEFTERCKDKSKLVRRDVKVAKPIQPLGKCDVGSSVTVIEQPPQQGDWVHKSATTQGPIKVTIKNNHFGFTEQQAANSPEPQVPQVPAKSAPSSPIPSEPTQPTQPGGGETGNPYATGNVGVDISWPQCGTPNETPSGVDFGIVGVNGETGYTTNPCLSAEAANFNSAALNLYVFSGWNIDSLHNNPNSPKECAAGDENCLAYNYGWNAGSYAVNAALADGVEIDTPWWIDVESSATWSSDPIQNQNSIQGEHDALVSSGATSVGVYSTTQQWQDITGGWRNEWPSWGATTWGTPEEAQTYCTGHEFTGGPSELMQYQPGGIDHDVAC